MTGFDVKNEVWKFDLQSPLMMGVLVGSAHVYPSVKEIHSAHASKSCLLLHPVADTWCLKLAFFFALWLIQKELSIRPEKITEFFLDSPRMMGISSCSIRFPRS